MLKIASLTLLAVYTLSSVRAQVGSAGQDCTPADDDLPTICLVVDQELIATENSIECKENYDCCLCGLLECAPDCKSFKANGDYAAYGVPEIIIDGSSSKGATIDCDGDSSCELTVIDATNVNGIKCGGDKSCEASKITADCLECKVECSGDHSCKESEFDLKNVESISCDDRSCVDSKMTVTTEDKNFKLECGSQESCKGAEINIIVDGDEVSELKSIDCGSFESCLGAEITITNIGSDPVEISKITCGAQWSCNYATFKIVGNIEVANCDCSVNACTDTVFDGFTCNIKLP